MTPGPARWIGARARQAAFEAELSELEETARAASTRAVRYAKSARDSAARAATLAEALERLELLDFAELGQLVFERDHATRRIRNARDAFAAKEAELEAERSRARELETSLEAMRRSIEEQGLEAVQERLSELVRELARVRQELESALLESGQVHERREALTARRRALRDELQRCEEAHAAARAALLPLVPEDARADLDDFVLRRRRGAQVLPENLDARREETLRREERWVTSIEGSDGVRHTALWQKYAFRYERDANTLIDSAGRGVDEDAARLQAEVEDLTRALSQKNEELLERVVLEELVGVLRRDVVELRDTVRGVNGLIEELEFGRTRYRIEARLKPEFKRLSGLLERSSALSPSAQEDLKAYFGTRLEEFSSAGGDAIPEFLDYRRWYDFHMRVSSTGADGVELTVERRAQGSGGEQAVPNYLLLFCLTTLLYDGIDAGVRVLLLDEAFYGVDSGRRDELLRFCDRARIDLVVATPEMDGVTESLRSSTTVLVEKTATNDVFLWDARFRKAQADLFEVDPVAPDEIVLGSDPAPNA